MVIGITGGSGGGKTTVSKEFEKAGFYIIDADVVAHSTMSKNSDCLKEVICEFGEEYLNKDNEIDRKKLGALVFNNKEKLEKLNEITHKHIVKNIKAMIKENTVIDAIGLFESELDKLCDSTIFVYCPKELRIKRIVERENITVQYAKDRINAQKKDEYYKKRATYTVINDNENDILTQLKGFYGEEVF